MTRFVLLAAFVTLFAMTGLGQVACYDFENGSLASSDTDPESVASNVSSPQNFMLAGGNFCFTSDWAMFR